MYKCKIDSDEKNFLEMYICKSVKYKLRPKNFFRAVCKSVNWQMCKTHSGRKIVFQSGVKKRKVLNGFTQENVSQRSV